MAYGNIYPNKGAMTPGSGGETADGMSEGKIDQIIELMRHERYRFPPARRLYIPKKNGKLRPLGLPDWSGKIVGEVVRLLLEAYYEPSFSDRSHGFRKGRGCHTALREVRDAWTGTVWFIEGDISDCYGSMDHQVLLSILAEKIDDQRFLRLVRNMLKAGYLEDWVRHDTLSGVPQGGVASPILSCIYLDKLDKFVEQELIPQYTRGASRTLNPEYRETANRLRNARRRGDRAEARELGKRLRGLPSRDPMDPGYRRLKYIRYADDHLLGFIGPKAEAEQIKARLATFLRETLGLELNQDKTLISHARTQPARFLGYDIIVQHCNTRITKGRRAANGIAALRVPPDVVKAKCAPYRQHGKPWHRPELQNLPDYDIVRIYGAEYRGVVNYYLLAQDVARLTALRWNAETSMLKTLGAPSHSRSTGRARGINRWKAQCRRKAHAEFGGRLPGKGPDCRDLAGQPTLPAKHKSTVATMAARHKAKVITGDGPRTCFEASLKREGRKDLIAQFGGIILRQDRRAVIQDPAPVPVHAPRKELIHRLLKRRCELCEQSATVAVHQVAGLKQLGEPGTGQPAWAALMARMRRKTLIVCAACHDYIHANPVTRAA